MGVKGVVARDYVLLRGGGVENIPALKVPRQYPFALLVKVGVGTSLGK
jgi:hypothetical protein